MASTSDKITDVRNAARPNSARATGIRTAGGSTLSCDNLAGWPVASKVHFVTYQIDSGSNPVIGTQLDCSGIVSGNDIASFTVIDGADTGNIVGDVVEMLPTAAWGQDLADALTAQHTRLGGHKSVTTDTLAVTAGTTLPAGDIGTADIADSAITQAKLSTIAGEVGGTWIDYSATSTIVGWASFTVKQIFYKQIGKVVHVAVDLEGTSNASGITFTLPIAASTHLNNYEGIPGLIEDVATAVGPGRWNITPAINPNLVTVFINAAGGGFNSSGTKVVRVANITYEAA